MVFANVFPPLGALSEDRWEFFKLVKAQDMWTDSYLQRMALDQVNVASTWSRANKSVKDAQQAAFYKQAPQECVLLNPQISWNQLQLRSQCTPLPLPSSSSAVVSLVGGQSTSPSSALYPPVSSSSFPPSSAELSFLNSSTTTPQPTLPEAVEDEEAELAVPTRKRRMSSSSSSSFLDLDNPPLSSHSECSSRPSVSAMPEGRDAGMVRVKRRNEQLEQEVFDLRSQLRRYEQQSNVTTE